MYYSIALKSTGAAWSWGSNASGQLGTNNITSYSSPVLVVGSHSFIYITTFNFSTSANGSTLGLKSDGLVWAWGNNASGQLGTGNTTSYSSPVLVVGNHSFTSIYCAGNHTIALKASGEVWCWGVNESGQLGTGNTTSYSSPVLVVGSHSFTQIAVAMGRQHTLALKSDGSVWTWGSNASGQLGDNSITNKSSPVLVVGSHSFIKITAGLDFTSGLKANGFIWSWGANGSGQLGDNSITNRSSPVLVVGSHSFTNIKSSIAWNIALKSSGQVWAWGNNTVGQLGTNNTTSYSSPVLVVGSHSFNQIASGRYHAMALKADGAIWCWGLHNYGQLGNGNISAISYSSPILVVGSHSFTTLMNAVNVTVTVVPTITDAGDETFTPIESNVVITGTNFKTTQSTGKVELANNSVYASATIKQSLTVTSWSDTSITVTISLGSLTQGFLWLYVTNSDSNVSNSYKVYVSDGVGKYYGMKFLTDSSQSLATVSNFTPPDRTNGGTVCFWVTSTHLTGAHSLMGCSSIYEIRTDGTVLYNDLNHGTSLGSDIAVDTRFHVACAYGGTLGLNGVANYLNGINDTSSGAATGNPSPAAFQIGQSQGVYFTGYLEDVRVYNRNLSEAEILTIYSNRGGDGIVHGLVNRWPLCCGPEGVAASGASSIKDLGINSLNMTPTNSPIFNGTDLKQKRRLY